MRGFSEEGFPGLREQYPKLFWRQKLIIAGLQRHSLAVQCGWFPDFTFYGDMRGK